MPEPRPGYCELCGKKIPRERLEILPDTTTCVDCSQTSPYTEVEALGTVELSNIDSGFNTEDYEGEAEEYDYDE